LSTPRVYVDFSKRDGSKRLLLTTVGTREDLQRYKIDLQEGMILSVYSDDAGANGKTDNLLADGVVHYDAENSRWVLDIDWGRISHESDTPNRNS
jgi:hypothetical protein